MHTSNHMWAGILVLLCLGPPLPAQMTLEGDAGWTSFDFESIDPTLSAEARFIRETASGVEGMEPGYDSEKWRAFVAAEKAMAQGKLEPARTIFVTLGTLIPENYLLIEKRGFTRLLCGEYEASLQAWYELLSKAPNRTDMLPPLGRCLLHLGREEEAHRVFSVCARLPDRELEGRLFLACIMLTRDRPQQVAQELGLLPVPWQAHLLYRLAAEQAYFIHLLGAAHYHVLLSYVMGGGDSAAVRTAGIADNSRILLDASRALLTLEDAYRLKQPARAEAALQRARASGVDGKMIRAYAAFGHVLRGEAPQAKEQMQNLVKQYPQEPLLLHFYGMLLVELQDYEAALDPLQRALQLGENDPDVRFAYIAALCGAGRKGPAWSAFEQMAMEHPQITRRYMRDALPMLDPIRDDARFPGLMGLE